MRRRQTGAHQGERWQGWFGRRLTMLKFRQQGWWREETVLDDFHNAAHEHPDKAAIVGVHRDASRECLPEVVTYRQLGCLVDQIASGLLRLEVAPGDVVSYQLPNWGRHGTPLLA